MLFSGASIFDVLQSQKQKLKEKIQSLQADYLLNASEQDLIAWLVDEFNLDVPTIDESKIETEYRETQIDVSRDPQRMIFDRSRPFYMPGTEVTFILPFTGDASFLDVQPQHFTYSSSGSKAAVMNGEIRFTYANASLNAAAAKREFENEVQHIKQNLQNLKDSVNQHNAQLEQEIRQQVPQRKQKLLNDAQITTQPGCVSELRAWDKAFQVKSGDQSVSMPFREIDGNKIQTVISGWNTGTGFKKAGEKTIKNRVGTLRLAWKWAREWGYTRSTFPENLRLPFWDKEEAKAKRPAYSMETVKQVMEHSEFPYNLIWWVTSEMHIRVGKSAD
jgi:hypothetical protein